MEIFWIILLLFLYAFLEFIAAFFFNYKLRMIDKQKYFSAALLGSVSTIIFFSLTSFAAFFATMNNGEITTNMWWFILVAAAMMAIGNICATLILPSFEKYLRKRTKKKEQKILNSNIKTQSEEQL